MTVSLACWSEWAQASLVIMRLSRSLQHSIQFIETSALGTQRAEKVLSQTPTTTRSTYHRQLPIERTGLVVLACQSQSVARDDTTCLRARCESLSYQPDHQFHQLQNQARHWNVFICCRTSALVLIVVMQLSSEVPCLYCTPSHMFPSHRI